MYMTIFKLIWPYLARQGAAYAADYLESRRQQRQAQPEERPADRPPCPPCPEPAAAAERSAANLIWFSLSGVLLSAALGLAGYLLVRDSR